MNENILRKLKKLSDKAYNNDEVPVAAIITLNNKVISSAINNKEDKSNVLGHAEINVIKKASKKLGTWKLDNLVLYTTLEPCNMCQEVIKASRIKKVYYLSKSIKQINYKTKFSFKKITYFEEIIKKFFKNKRI